MEKIATENLFLLEFLVDSVNMNPKCDCADGEGERCVSFQFLDNAPLDVCEEDFTPPGKQQQNEKDTVKSGKSCLFSLSPEQANAALNKFDIYVTILKKMPAGWLPERVEVGEALISIANLFSELINSVESSDGSTPTAKTLKDCFDVNNSNGEAIGKIGVYIRMSCFGKLIVTQFQMNLEDKSVLFKDKEGKSLYRYKKAGKGKSRKEVCTPRFEAAQGGYNAPEANYNNMQRPMSPLAGNIGNFYGHDANQGGYNVQCPINPCMGDMSMMPGIQTPCKECGMQQNAPCIPPNQNFQYGAFPNTMGYYGGPGGARVPSCMASPDPVETENPPNTPQNEEKRETYPSDTAPVEVCGEKPVDEDKEVFVLRIGKKKEGSNKNPKLELEMCTPKGKELKPIPRKETRDTQYDPADAAPEVKGKKGKDKGGKGKKGKGKKK